MTTRAMSNIITFNKVMFITRAVLLVTSTNENGGLFVLSGMFR